MALPLPMLNEIRRVLIVEDDEAWVVILSKLFSSNCQVSVAYKYHDARNIIAAQKSLIEVAPDHPQAQPIELILLDLRLPDSLPKDTVKQMYKLAPDIPTVVTSGQLNKGLVALCIKCNMGVISKDLQGLSSFPLAMYAEVEASKQMRCSLFDLTRDTIEAAMEDTAKLAPATTEVDRLRARKDLIIVPIFAVALAVMPFYVMEKLPTNAWGEYCKYIIAICAIGAFALTGILTPVLNAYFTFRNKWAKFMNSEDKEEKKEN